MAKFIHLRIRNEQGEPLPNGGLCIAFDTVQDENGEDVFFAIARCSKHDMYNRKKGRTIAEGRLTRWLLTRSPKLEVIHLNGRKPREAILSAVKDYAVG